MHQRKMLDHSSVEFARRTVAIMTNAWSRFELTIDEWLKYLRDAREYHVWIQLGYATLDEMLVEQIGHTLQESLRVLTDAQRAQLAAENPNTGTIGEPVNEKYREPVTNSNTLGCRSRAKQNGVGMQTQHTLDRLAREKPKLLSKVKAGAISVNAAAIEAGFRQKTFAVPVDVQRAAATLRKHFTATELQKLKDLL